MDKTSEVDMEAMEAAESSAMERFAPDWPGLKLGVECAEDHGEESLRLWRLAACVEPDMLRQFAARALALMGGHEGFPWSQEDLEESQMIKAGDQSDRGALRLGEAQALAAIMWALAPIYEEFDAEKLRADSVEACRLEGVLREPIHVIQLPMAPSDGVYLEGCRAGEGDVTTGNWFRVSFSFLRDGLAHAVPSGEGGGCEPKKPSLADGHRAKVRAASGKTVEGLKALGGLPSSGHAEEDGVNAGLDGRMRRLSAWELHTLGSFKLLWDSLELAIACSDPQEADKKGPRL